MMVSIRPPHNNAGPRIDAEHDRHTGTGAG